MANHIYVHCQSDELIKYRDIAERMAVGHFDEPPTLNPPSEGDVATRTGWQTFELFWHPERRPIYVERITDRARITAIVDEVAEKFEDYGLEDSRHLVARLRTSKQTFHFEFGELSDNAWDMLDDIEIYLSKRLDGIVEALEGLYDSSLSPLVVWEPEEE